MLKGDLAAAQKSVAAGQQQHMAAREQMQVGPHLLTNMHVS